MLASSRVHSCSYRPKLVSSSPAARAAGSRFAASHRWGPGTPGQVQAAAENPFTGHKALIKPNRTASIPTDRPEPSAAELLNTYQWPLLAAATQQRWEICQQLLDMGTSDPPDGRQVAAWYAANAGRTQLAVALLKSASATPPDAGGAGVSGSDGDAAEVSLGLKVLHQAWSRALERKDVKSCRILLDQFPELLRHAYTKSALTREDPDKTVVEFLLEACLQRGDSYQQLHSDLLQAALKGAVRSSGSDTLRALLEKGVDVNAGQQAFTEDSPLAAALGNSWRSPECVRVLLDHGAHVHADPTRPRSRSALQFAIETGGRDTSGAKMLLSCGRVQVGGPELCAAARKKEAATIQLVLQAEGNLKPSLKASVKERGRCLKKALTVAVRTSQGHRYAFEKETSEEDWSDPKESRQIVEALLKPPAHWHPLPPDLLDVGVKEAIRAIRKHNGKEELYELIEVVEVLGKAGADLNIEEGALLTAAAQAQFSWEKLELLKALLRGGLDVRIHGEAALKAAPNGEFAAELIRAGVPVSSDTDLRKRLMKLAAAWRLSGIGPLLGALDKNGAVVKGPLTSKDAGGAGAHDKSEDVDSEMSEDE